MFSLKYIAYALAALALVAAIVLGVSKCKQTEADQDNQLVNAGVTQERSESQGEVINHVQNAQDAVTNPSSDDLNIVCSKYDRNCPTNRK